MIDTCPTERIDLLEKYQAEMAVVKEFAPQLITDRETIKMFVSELIAQVEVNGNKNRGTIMRLVAQNLKGKADMKIVNNVVAEMLV